MMRVKEAAARLEVHPSTVYRWIELGLLEAVRYGKPRPVGSPSRGRGGAIRIPESAVAAVLIQAAAPLEAAS